jgi:biopolymer transport protein ExbB
MRALWELLGKGGPAMIAIVVLSVVLYSRCFKLLLSLRRSRANLKRVTSTDDSILRVLIPDLRLMRKDVRDSFRQQRIALAAMIAAAPLLGLLGTVSGMVKTFETLSARAADKSMEGLARGISEVLVATESGLLVALPALLFVWLAHREVTRHVQQLNQLERKVTEGAL